MSILICNWTMKDWEELVKWARIGENNGMIGVNTDVVELPPHGDLIDAQREMMQMRSSDYDTYDDYNRAFDMLDNAPTIIPAEGKEADA